MALHVTMIELKDLKNGGGTKINDCDNEYLNRKTKMYKSAQNNMAAFKRSSKLTSP
jgi:hypothetical protein